MLAHWIWLATRSGLKAGQVMALLNRFSGPEELYYADLDSCGDLHLSAQMRKTLQDKDLSEAERILGICRAEKIHILTIRDAQYPSRLKNIADPPVVLYYKGILPDFDAEVAIGIVGTRKASAYGLTIAKRMGYEIGKCGGIVVSGGAYGIDGLAMRGALSAGDSVVGVLGCGVDIVYPPSNGSLFADLQENGCLISEFPPGTAPLPYHFPMRNRIISGLCNGVLVIEAPKKSGALITADLALQQGRDVFAVPGNIGVESAEGSNALLKDGATPVTCGWDVLEEYAVRYPGKIRKYEPALHLKATAEELEQQAASHSAKVAQERLEPGIHRDEKASRDKKGIDKEECPPYIDGSDIPGLTEQERVLVDILKAGERSIDALTEASGLSSSAFMAALTMLEMKGIVMSLPGKRVAIKK